MQGKPQSHVAMSPDESNSANNMPTNRRPSSRRRDMIAALLEAVRRTGSLTVLMSQEAADRVGINATDLNCLNVLSFNDTLTAGQLARAMGLTTASITAVIDRLEKVGYARRERDQRDRRRVVVHLAADAVVRDVRPVFRPMIGAWHRITAGYTDDELELIVKFQCRAAEIISEQLNEMRAKPREKYHD